MKKLMVITFILIVGTVLTGCDYIDVGQLWAFYDPCGNRTTQETATGICGLWWQLATGEVSQGEVHTMLSTTATAQAVRATAQAAPAQTATPIPPPVHRPVQKFVELTPTAISPYSPVYPTPTATPFGGIYIPDLDDYKELLEQLTGGSNE